jgi:hypothetical protein
MNFSQDQIDPFDLRIKNLQDQNQYCPEEPEQGLIFAILPIAIQAKSPLPQLAVSKTGEEQRNPFLIADIILRE